MLLESFGYSISKRATGEEPPFEGDFQNGIPGGMDRKGLAGTAGADLEVSRIN